MSSPKRASAKSASSKPASNKLAPKPKSRPSARLTPPARAAAKPAANGGSASSDATRLAAEIERSLASGKLDMLTPQALHALMGACCKNYATRVGRERVIASSDCGFAQSAFTRRVHPSIMWAKFRALREGADIATKDLWK